MRIIEVITHILVWIAGYPVVALIAWLEAHCNGPIFSLDSFILYMGIVLVVSVCMYFADKAKDKEAWKSHKTRYLAGKRARVLQEQEHKKQIELARAAQEEIDRRQQAALQEAFMREQQTEKASDGASTPENGTDEEENAAAP